MKSLNYLQHLPCIDDKSTNPINKLYVVGNVTDDVPFLIESKDKRPATPFFLYDEGNKGCLHGEPFVMEKEKRKSIEVPIIGIERKFLRLPTVAINLDENRYEYLCGISSVIRDLDKTNSQNGKKTIFLPYLAFSDNALFVHKNIEKGDTICGLGRLILTKVPKLDLSKTVLWIDDIQLIRKAKRNLPEGEEV